MMWCKWSRTCTWMQLLQLDATLARHLLFPSGGVTIQGDSLSPLLFIIFMEPLLRVLNVNDRGYRCHSVRGQWPHYANSFAVADDLGLASSSKLCMQIQLDKVTHCAGWAGMVLAPGKCVATGALWNQASIAEPIF